MSVFEMIMLICFGTAWPVSIYKSWNSRSAKGKSIIFLAIIEIGYLAGIAYKLTGNFNYVFYLYLTNAVMVLVDILLYVRNRRLDASCLPAEMS